jgi:hypothetical protein
LSSIFLERNFTSVHGMYVRTTGSRSWDNWGRSTSRPHARPHCQTRYYVATMCARGLDSIAATYVTQRPTYVICEILTFLFGAAFVRFRDWTACHILKDMHVVSMMYCTTTHAFLAVDIVSRRRRRMRSGTVQQEHSASTAGT